MPQCATLGSLLYTMGQASSTYQPQAANGQVQLSATRMPCLSTGPGCQGLGHTINVKRLTIGTQPRS